WQVRKDFVAQNPSLFSHLPLSSLTVLITSPVLKQAIEAFWKRDLVSAQKLFRAILLTSSWQKNDLKYLLPALLPLGLYRQVVRLLEKS
ncbi:MAG: hypothetical protein PHE96_03735, partial [Methylococcales bacterium]|nr:hypothetical protein [Methylococcales bacterium]